MRVKAGAVTGVPAAVRDIADRLDGLGWVTDLLVTGSLATGGYVLGGSDMDLVALTEGPVCPARQEVATGLHRALDRGPAQGLDPGCVYVDVGRLADTGALHPTWTHGSLVHRVLSMARGRHALGTGQLLGRTMMWS